MSTVSDHDAERLNTIIARLVGSQDATDIKAAYRDWAESYDQDLDSFGYVAPQIGVELLHNALNDSNGLLFDAGCGTGLCGERLAAYGYSRIHGADFSREMLEKARHGGHYQQLTEVDFRQPLNQQDAHYDGCLSIGVYSSFIGSSFISELIRVTKPGGIICISCRFNYYENDLQPQIDCHQENGILTIRSEDTLPYMTGQDAQAVYLVLEKL